MVQIRELNSGTFGFVGVCCARVLPGICWPEYHIHAVSDARIALQSLPSTSPRFQSSK